MKKTISAISFAAVLLLLSGCASMIGKPQVGPHGEDLVWIGSVRYLGGESRPDSNVSSTVAQAASMATSSPMQAGLVGGVVSTVLSMGGTNKSEPKIQIFYWPTSQTVLRPSFPQLYRKPWPGASGLEAKSWAILSRDEIGPILLPCPGCKPVNESQ